jgi:hypothetical protein
MTGPDRSGNELDCSTDGQPPCAPADVRRRLRRFALACFSSLAEVLPPLVVERDGDEREYEAAQLDGFRTSTVGPPV